MNKEELLKEVMELPMVEIINPISAMNGINVDDLMSAIDRLNKIPDYNDLLKENEELKKQLEDMTLCRDIASGHREEVQDRETILLNQQKEFISYLEDKIYSIEPKETGIIYNCEYDSEEDYVMAMQEQSRLNALKEILQKYKSIIGVSDENKRN